MKNSLFAVLLFILASCFAPAAEGPPSVVLFSDSYGKTTDSGPKLYVAVWADGRIVWSRDQAKGGPPYLTGHIEAKGVAALLERADDQGVFDPKSFRHSWTVPDGGFLSIWLQIETRHASLQSGYAGDKTPDYQKFRKVWDDLRPSIVALIPKEGEAYTGPTKWKLPQ